MKYLFTPTLCILLLAACASKEPEPIMTDEKFESRVLEDGLTEFVFGISWRDTSQSSLVSSNSRDSERRPPERPERGEMGAGRMRFAVQADNQTKLELEDKAAEGLNQRLQKEKLCPNGHQITNVIWRDDNIRLVGHCL